jgi:cytochrome c biogenesis protein CcmG, thiol:disulfide interchange protein DsbE
MTASKGWRRTAPVVLLLVAAGLVWRPLARHDLVGKPAPDFQANIVANGAALGGSEASFALRELRGRTVLLVFWATWCNPCREESVVVNDAWRRWHDRNVVVVGISTDTPGQGDPAIFATEHGLRYPIVQDTTREATSAYRVDTLPTLVVVTRDGKVAGQRVGTVDSDDLDELLRLAQ